MSTDTFAFDAALRDWLEQHIEQHELSHADIANRFHVSPTRITKYLGLNKPDHKPEPDAGKIQSMVKAMRRHTERRASFKESLFENDISNDIATVFKRVRRTGDIGLIYGDAGAGKTCGAELFCRDNPDSILLTMREYARNSHAIKNMLFDELMETSKTRYPGNVAVPLWMEDVLRGSERLIIVDNAQRLNLKSFKWFMDFNDATESGIVFIANPEALDTLRESDQLFSRIGIVHQVRSQTQRDAEHTAKKLIEQLAPGADGELLEPALEVISRLGKARALKKQLILAAELKDGNRAWDWLKAFTTAGAMLVKPVKSPRRRE